MGPRSPRRARPCCRSRGGSSPTPTARAWRSRRSWAGPRAGAGRRHPVAVQRRAGRRAAGVPRAVPGHRAGAGRERVAAAGAVAGAGRAGHRAGDRARVRGRPGAARRAAAAGAAVGGVRGVRGRPPSARGSMGLRELARRSLVVPREGYDLRESTLRAFADAGVARGSPCRVGRWTPCCGWSRRAPAWRWCPTSCSPGARGCGARCSPLRSTGRSRWPRGRICGRARPPGAFRATLLTFLAELSAVGGFPGDVQVLRHPDP